MLDDDKLNSFDAVSVTNAHRMGDDIKMQVVHIAVEKIVPHPAQPRKTVTEESIDEMVESLKRHGQLQPIGVKVKNDSQYTLIFGQRRWLAHKKLGIEKIAAVLNDGDIELLALVENLQREDLSPIEQSQALVALMELKAWNGRQLAAHLGKPYRSVVDVVSITKKVAPDILEQARERREIKASHLIDIGRSKTHEEQRTRWNALKDDRGTTVRAVKESRQPSATSDRKRVPSQHGLIRAANRWHHLLVKTESLDDDQSAKSLRRMQTKMNKEIRRLVNSAKRSPEKH